MMSKRRNIFLTGMMGTGKSTVGRRLAEKLNMTFVDTDEVVESMMGMSIEEIFKESGEQTFRDVESACFIEISPENNQVFSTGGGIVVRKENRQILRNDGFTALLKVHPRTLAERIGKPSTRPLLHNADDVEERLSEIWNARKVHYESTANLTIDKDDLSCDDVVKTIIDHLEKLDEDD